MNKQRNGLNDPPMRAARDSNFEKTPVGMHYQPQPQQVQSPYQYQTQLMPQAYQQSFNFPSQQFSMQQPQYSIQWGQPKQQPYTDPLEPYQPQPQPQQQSQKKQQKQQQQQQEQQQQQQQPMQQQQQVQYQPMPPQNAAAKLNAAYQEYQQQQMYAQQQQEALQAQYQQQLLEQLYTQQPLPLGATPAITPLANNKPQFYTSDQYANFLQQQQDQIMLQQNEQLRQRIHSTPMPTIAAYTTPTPMPGVPAYPATMPTIITEGHSPATKVSRLNFTSGNVSYNY